jgi:ribonucleotide monophosphatase NagD (HAD superfamily)
LYLKKYFNYRLKASGLPVRFCTNETTTTRKKLVEKLSKVGFELKETEIFPPIPAVCKILQQRSLRPYLIVTDGKMLEYFFFTLLVSTGFVIFPVNSFV